MATAASTSSLWSRSGVPGHFGAPLPPIVGRGADVDRVLELIDSDEVRLVTVLGPGGVGKTRLAMAIAERIAPSFAHGACFVALESVLHPDLVPKAIAQVMGLRESMDRQAPDLVVDVLADKHMLLVIDNVEHVIAASPWISRLITEAPRLRMLVTSRIPLHIRGEQEYQLDPLDVVDDDLGPAGAVDLFVQRAREVKRHFAPDSESVDVVVEICRKLDGLPLAIELAAAWMKVLSPQSLLERLDDRLSVLSGAHPDIHPRLQSMSQAIGWSYDLLSPAEQVLMCRLSMFVGGFSLEAAEFVACWPDPPGRGGRGLSLLQSLVDQSLVQALPDADYPTFRMLETVREYGLQRSLSDDADLARKAHAEYYRHLSARAEQGLLGPDQVRWLNILEQEYPNIRLAMTWLEAHGLLHQAIEIASHIQFFVNIRGHTGEELQRLTGWIDSSLLVSGTPERALALMAAGRLHQNTGHLEWSVAMLTEAAAIFLTNDDLRHAAMARAMLAVSYWIMGLKEEMVELAESALELTVPLGLHRMTGACLSVLAAHAMMSGDQDRAQDLREQGVRAATEAGDLWGMSFGLGYQSLDAFHAGNLDNARRYAEELLHILEQLGSLHDLPDAWNMLAWIARKQRDLDTASEHLATASSIAFASGNRRLAALLQMRAGIVRSEQGQVSEAASLLRASTTTWSEQAPPLLDLAELLDAYAALAVRSGDLASAARFLGSSASIARQAGIDPDSVGFDAGGSSLSATVQAGLGADQFSREYAEGSAWKVRSALAEARAYRPVAPGDRSTVKSAQPPRVSLSPRELEVLGHMANGLSNQQIADELSLSHRTVTTHVTRILDKLEVSSRTAAVSFAIRNALV